MTKKEIAEYIIRTGECANIKCVDCPFCGGEFDCNRDSGVKLAVAYLESLRKTSKQPFFERGTTTNKYK